VPFGIYNASTVAKTPLPITTSRPINISKNEEIEDYYKSLNNKIPFCSVLNDKLSQENHLQKIKNLNPDLKVGIFGLISKNNSAAIDFAQSKINENVTQWQKTNNENVNVMNAQDIHFPSLFIENGDKDVLLNNNDLYLLAKGTVLEAKRISNKPTIAFVSPFIYETDVTLSPDNMVSLMQGARDAGAYGIVLFAPNITPGSTQLQQINKNYTEILNNIDSPFKQDTTPVDPVEPVTPIEPVEPKEPIQPPAPEIIVPTMHPEQPFRSTKTPQFAKPVFTSIAWDRIGTVPFGTIPMIVDGGGRFDSDLNKEGMQWDSFWVGGYYGPTQFIDYKKLEYALKPIPSGTFYCFNVEHWPIDIRKNTDAQVENSIRKWREFFINAKKFRPDLRYLIYAQTPNRDYWTPIQYHHGLKSIEKANNKETLTSEERWYLSRMSSLNNNQYSVNEKSAFFLNFKAWQFANDRTDMGRDNKGKIRKTWGLTDMVDIVCPSLYRFYGGTDDEGYIRYNILESRRISKNRKKIIPFMWPYYHDSNRTLKGQLIPLDEWRKDCRLVLKYADGVVLWTAQRTHSQPHVDIALEEAELAVR
jgi:hypothetical protein